VDKQKENYISSKLHQLAISDFLLWSFKSPSQLFVHLQM